VRVIVCALVPLAATLGVIACADAPITPDQLEADGQLRAPTGQAAFSAQSRTVLQQATQFSAVLAAEGEGALVDASSFPADVGTVHLHMRADGLSAQRPVMFRWTWGDQSVLVPGTLLPSSTLTLASSFDIGPDEAGPWRVEVVEQVPADTAASAGVPVEPTERVLFSREFEVMRPSG
jgi:hypothetical protein